jgi:hypothetical protein
LAAEQPRSLDEKHQRDELARRAMVVRRISTLTCMLSRALGSSEALTVESDSHRGSRVSTGQIDPWQRGPPVLETGSFEMARPQPLSRVCTDGFAFAIAPAPDSLLRPISMADSPVTVLVGPVGT